MSNYNSLSTNELINLLNQKDNELQNKDNEITSLENKLTVAQQNNGTTTENPSNTADSIIASIIALEETEQKSLPALIRTTENGVKAYSIFLYGVASGLDASNEVPATVNS